MAKKPQVQIEIADEVPYLPSWDLWNTVSNNEHIKEVYLHVDESYSFMKHEIDGKFFSRTEEVIAQPQAGITMAAKARRGIAKFEIVQTISREDILKAKHGAKPPYPVA